MKRIRSFLTRLGVAASAAFGLSVGTSLSAAEFEVCDCAAGAVSGCIAGDDGNDGAPGRPWRSYERARQAFAGLAAGDAIRFCRGGSWVIGAESGTRWVNNACRADNRCTVGSYLPVGMPANTLRPILQRINAAHMFALENGGMAVHEEGYVLESLDIRGSGGGSNGIFLYNEIDDVRISDFSIRGFGIGVHVAGSNSCAPGAAACNGENERIRLLDSHVIGNVHQGWLGGSDGSEIIGNEFDRNGSTAVLDHNIYLAGDTLDMRVAHNRLRHSALDAQGLCKAVSLVAHGKHQGLVVEYNWVEEDLGAAGEGCWGIALDHGYGNQAEAFVDVVVRGNTVVNVGNVGIGTSNCRDCVIENNIVVSQQPFASAAIAVPSKTPTAEDLPQQAMSIRNNAILIDSDTASSGIRLGTQGDMHSIVSNAIVYLGTHSVFDCLQLNLAPASYADIDYNLCHTPMAASAEWSAGNGSLSAWQQLTGFDLHSLTLDPAYALTHGTDLSPVTANSPMVNAGHPTASSTSDHNGFARDAQPDIGAYEWRSDSLHADGFED